MLQLDPDLVRTRIAADVPAFVSVGLAADLGRITRETLRWPSAWVILLGETAGENHFESCDMIEQAITARVGVIMAVRDIADRRGAQAGTALRPLREAVLLSLGRFMPEDCTTAFRFVRGQLQSGIGTDGGLFWQDEFNLRFDRRIQIS